MGKRLEQTLPQIRRVNGSKHKKRCLTSPGMREILAKPQWDTMYTTSIRTATSKKLNTCALRAGMEKGAAVVASSVPHAQNRKQNLYIIQQFHIWAYIQKNWQQGLQQMFGHHVHGDIFHNIKKVGATLVSTDKWINRMWSPTSMEYYSASKKERVWTLQVLQHGWTSRTWSWVK